MNHWFLVGRDVMWFFIAIGPIMIASIPVNTDSEASIKLVIASGYQLSLLAAIYAGFIR